MKNKRYFSFILLPVLLIACNQAPAKKEAALNDDSSQSKSPLLQNGFFDSVATRKELTTDQVRAYLKLDSSYYTDLNAEAVFTGDSVVKLPGNNRAVFISYNDARVCTAQFLFSFTAAGVNQDFLELSRDCDRDESSGYWTLNYTTINDSSWLVRKAYYLPGDPDKPVEETEIKCVLNRQGVIVKTIKD